jgi:alkyl sulfatase BDS1-like metallo-beta-lactamase superfamily hydrolase
MIFDFLAVRLDHRKVDGLNFGISLTFTDSNETYALELSNGVLNNTKGRVLKKPDVALSLTRPALFKMLLAKVPLAKLVEAGEARLEGDAVALRSIFANLKDFDPMFNMVTP